ncbi:uncharacterized protein LOC111276174 [Durio zibethinus]|uniref:Uncharacterized protein LOC111276174 n=1 Tax=Durio zibethinus TaxID=66656 RepID=A0A6P5WNX1_DURZI|nr:uncharacterized protein LOC111276174 [Durio zibethinus]
MSQTDSNGSGQFMKQNGLKLSLICQFSCSFYTLPQTLPKALQETERAACNENYVSLDHQGSPGHQSGLAVPEKSANSTPQAATLIHCREFAGGGGDHHGPTKVNLWEDPMNPSKWKEDHFVIVSLTGWGLLFYGGYKYFTRGKKEEKEEERVGQASK